MEPHPHEPEQALYRMARAVSHELNNIWMSIQAHAVMARESLPPDHDAQEDLREIQASLRQGQRICKQLSTYSQRRMARPTTLDLSAEVTHMAPLLDRLLPPGVSLALHPAPAPLLTVFDHDGLEQLLLTLLQHATEGAQAPGEVTLRVGSLTLTTAEAAALRPPARAGAYAYIELTTALPALSEGARRHLFEPFFTPHDQVLRPAIGLALCQGLVGQQGGGVQLLDGPHHALRALLPQLPSPT